MGGAPSILQLVVWGFPVVRNPEGLWFRPAALPVPVRLSVSEGEGGRDWVFYMSECE